MSGYYLDYVNEDGLDLIKINMKDQVYSIIVDFEEAKYIANKILHPNYNRLGSDKKNIIVLNDGINITITIKNEKIQLTIFCDYDSSKIFAKDLLKIVYRENNKVVKYMDDEIIPVVKED